MSIDPTRDPHARIVVKPLPSQVAAAKAKAAAESAEAAGGFGTAGIGVGSAGGVGAAGVGAKTAGGPAAASRVGAAGVGATAAGTTGLVPPPSASPRVASDDPFLRASNEDDDGYDPYSDRPAPPEPLFQEDPWA